MTFRPRLADFMAGFLPVGVRVSYEIGLQVLR
jgi:hypothetical protein